VIRKYARMEAIPQTVQAIFRDVRKWPSWMPTIESVEVHKESEEHALIEVRQRLMGRALTRTLEIRFDEQGYTETQVSGPLKRWKTVWRFVKPPVGTGTVVSTQVDIDIGMMKLVWPKRTVQRTIDELHDQIVRRAEARARRRETLHVPTVWGVQPGEKLSIKVYETPTELEVWFGERRYVVPYAE